MYDELKEENIVNELGGRFKLSTLIQKRLVQLNQGARPLVADQSGDRMTIVLREIREKKIYLDTSNELRTADQSPDFGETPELDLDDL